MSDQENVTFQEKLKQLDLKEQNEIQINSQNQNFFTFIQKKSPKSCLMPIFLIDVYHEETDPIYLIDQNTLTIKQISYANKLFENIQPGQSQIFDIDNQKDYQQELKQQDFLFGEGDYMGIIFCPYFTENQTNFGFKLIQEEYITSKLEITNFKEDMLNTGTFQNEFTLSLQPNANHFVKLTNLNDQFSINFDQSQSNVKIILEYDFNDQKYTSVFDKEPLFFYNSKELNLLLKNNKNIPITVNVTLTKHSQTIIQVTKVHENYHLKKIFLIFFLVFSIIVIIFFAFKLKNFKKKEQINQNKSDQDVKSLEKQKSLEIEKYFSSKYSFFHDTQEIDTKDMYSMNQINQVFKQLQLLQ